MIELALEAFVAKRSDEQDSLEKTLFPHVSEAVQTYPAVGWYDELLREAGRQYLAVFHEQGGKGDQPNPSVADFIAGLRATLDKTEEPDANTVDKISVWLSTAILNAGTSAATEGDDEFVLEWVTMHDSDVRLAHHEAEGQRRKPGEPFSVDNTPMLYPGDSSVAIDLWINCRCSLRPTKGESSAVAAQIERWTTGSSVTTELAGETEMLASSTDDEDTDGETQEEDMDPKDETEQVEQSENEASGLIPWHGVLAPEGVYSGDGRMFEEGALTHRDLPLPLTWQKATDEGHGGSVTVADIQGINMVDGLMCGWGHMLPIPEADEALGLIAHFGKYGVSVDADDAEMTFDEESGKVSFSKARVCSASIVSIPAFAEAYVKIGEPPAEWLADPDAETDLSLVAAAVAEAFKRGPGWITDPVATKRIHDYWTKPGEEGYAKIAWGTPGDFNRCRVEIGAKIAENSPEDVRFLNQICAQWHHDATGFWPGDAPAERGTASTETPEGEPAAAVSLVASGGWCAPSEMYRDPEFQPGDGFMVQDKTGEWIAPMQVTEEGRVFGHLAGWKTCHVGYGDKVCVAPPHSASDYAYFLTSIADTEDGPIPAGQLTIGGGHASGGLRPKAALAHYDSTSTVVADVTVGEDAYGIWYSGAVRPTATEDDVQTLRRSVLSGDWRKIAGEHELIAALGVNSGGFPVPRVGISDGVQVSLVAAGAVHPETPGETFDMSKFAAAVAKELRAQEVRRERMLAIKERVNGAS